MSEKSNDSVASVAHNIQNKLKKIQTRAVNFNKESGYFVTKSTMEKMLEDVESLMASGQTTMSDEGLTTLHTQITDLRKRAILAENKLKASQAAKALVEKDLETARESLTAARALHSELLASTNEDRERLTQKLTSVQHDIAEMKKVKGKTPEQKEKFDEIRAQANQMRNELAELNARQKSSAVTITTLEKQVASLAAENEALHEKAVKMAHISYAQAASGGTTGPLPPVKPLGEPSSYLLKKGFPESARVKVEEFLNLRKEEYREKAYKLMELANETDPKNILGVKNIAHLFFRKVKTSTTSQRAKLEPYYVDLYRFIVEGTGPPVRQLRSEFASLFSTDEKQNEKEQEQTKGKETWWQSFKYDFRIFRRTVSVNVQLWYQSSSLKKVMNAVPKFFSRFRFW